MTEISDTSERIAMLKLLTTAVATAMLVLGVAGCSQEEGAPTADPGAGSNQPGEQASPDSTVESDSANSTFGQAFTFRDGVAVGVSPPEPYFPSASASTDDPTGSFVAFTVTIVNGSDKNYDPALFSASLQSGNAEGDQDFDTANGISGAPSTVILPSRESQFKIAFEASNPADLVLQVSPGFEYRDAIFTS
ncbi:hypothetical protein DK926_04935 [Rhodococcus sp. Eu-32]|uniref:hypothetical protein n=1 Tax=Rhodococcus sp. Eu-32 TaxID=1017319 RepID=UPI000F779F8C|nr:hypothetical protein [Rhodococcus sp. Eu-32]RRQ29229.1 hypothetical protein DK926_04935 [Rhodococcus sp. Eu-32]